MQRRIDDTVRAQGQQGLDVVGCGDADRFVDPDEFGDVDADLRRAERERTDKLHVWAFENGRNRLSCDVAGGPLDDAEGVSRTHLRRWRSLGGDTQKPPLFELEPHAAADASDGQLGHFRRRLS